MVVCQCFNMWWMTTLSWLFLVIPMVKTRCDKTVNGKRYKLTIALLVDDNNPNATPQETILMDNIRLAGDAEKCLSPNYVKLKIGESLGLKKHGWAAIKTGMEDAMAFQGTKPNLIIGPFYTNLAMVLEKEGIPYLVTDYKGFDWIDMSRVEDTVKWKTIVEIRPPVQDQNLAVVDKFVVEEWASAIMIMPENPADNLECQDLASQLLNEEVSLIPHSVDVTSNGSGTLINKILLNVRLSRQRHIIVCSPRDERDQLIAKVLKAAKAFNLLSNEEQYFIFVDPSSYLLPFSDATNMFRLRLFSIRCHLLAFRYIRPEGKVDSAMDAAYMDAGRIITVGLSSYISEQTEVTDTFSGARFIKALKSVKLERGKTGKIHFNATGQRIEYKLDLYRHGGEKMYQRIAEWGLNGTDAAERLNQTVPDDGASIKAKYDIFPETVYVVVVIEKPFVMKKASVNGDKFEGFTIDLLESLSKSLKFNYKIYVSPNQYGVRKDDGTWDGMVGEIKNGNATLAMGAISITSKREIAIDFSLGVLTTGVNILISRPDDHYTIFQFLKPFSLELWITILGSFIVVSMVYFLLDYKRPSTKFTARETLWFSMGTLLKRGTDFSPEPISQRILTSGFNFFVLITVATYTANMAAFLTTKDFGNTVDSFESLADNDDISCGTVKNSATKHFLQMGTKPVFKRLWDKMIYSDGLVANSSEGQKKVANGNYAFVYDHLINSYVEGEYCNMKVVASPILMQEHGIGMKEGAAFKTSINIELLKLKENGQIQDWKKKWWEDKRKCDKDGKNKKKPRGQFGVAHMAGVFIFALFGMSCGVAFFLFKKFYLLAKPISEGTKEENMEGEDDNGDGEEERVKRKKMMHSTNPPVHL